MFKNPTEFSMFIEKTAFEKKQSYVDCILKFCEENYIDPEDIKGLVNKSLKEKIAQELIESNVLPRKETLKL